MKARTKREMIRRKLGKDQIAILGWLDQRGDHWNDACGWVWHNRSRTIALLETLRRRGLVRCGLTEWNHVEYRLVRPDHSPVAEEQQ